MVDTEAKESRKQGRKKLVSTMWTLDKVKSDFRDGYDEYLTRTAQSGNSGPGGELLRGANDPQPNNGGRAATERSGPLPDGLGQKAN